MAGTSATLSASALKKAIDRYYIELYEYQGKADYEYELASQAIAHQSTGIFVINWLLPGRLQVRILFEEPQSRPPVTQWPFL
jgi:hypothetical protein